MLVGYNQHNLSACKITNGREVGVNDNRMAFAVASICRSGGMPVKAFGFIQGLISSVGWKPGRLVGYEHMMKMEIDTDNESL